jgi:hypothetical protein
MTELLPHQGNWKEQQIQPVRNKEKVKIASDWSTSFGKQQVEIIIRLPYENFEGTLKFKGRLYIFFLSSITYSNPGLFEHAATNTIW